MEISARYGGTKEHRSNASLRQAQPDAKAALLRWMLNKRPRLADALDFPIGLPPRCKLLPCQIIRSSLQKWALCIVRVLPALCLRNSNTVDEGLRKL